MVLRYVSCEAEFPALRTRWKEEDGWCTNRCTERVHMNLSFFKKSQVICTVVTIVFPTRFPLVLNLLVFVPATATLHVIDINVPSRPGGSGCLDVPRH